MSIRRAWRRAWRPACVGVVVLSVLALTSACGEATGDPSAESATESAGAGPTSSSAPASPETTAGAGASAAPGSGATAAPALDPAYAVESPGPREGALTYADMLVYSQDALSPDMIAAIKDLKGVTGVEPMGMAQVTVEDRVLNVASVDPATYRYFTPAGSALTQEVWDRLAAGEIAIRPDLKTKLPIAADGNLRLGNTDTAPTMHVGAFAQQIKRVDAVVNDKRGAQLGMKADNALLVSLDITSPQSVRGPIQDIVGDQASVQILGPDLDTSVQQTAYVVGGVSEVVGTFNYTVLGGGRIAPEASWVAAHIATGDVPILGAVTCNKQIFPQLRAALNEIVARGLADKIHPGEYAGCYYPRFIAGSTSLSNHSFGTALDLNVPGNQRGTVGEMDRTVVEIFKRWGFAWGGDWSFTDPMHFEMARLVNPG